MQSCWAGKANGIDPTHKLAWVGERLAAELFGDTVRSRSIGVDHGYELTIGMGGILLRMKAP